MVFSDCSKQTCTCLTAEAREEIGRLAIKTADHFDTIIEDDQMTNRTLYPLLILLVICSSSLFGQESQTYVDEAESLKAAKEYYDLHLYGQARQAAKDYLQKTVATEHSSLHNHQRVDAASIYHLAALAEDLPEAESEMVSFLASQLGHPEVLDATFAIADYYYNERRYAKSIEYYDHIDIDALPEERMSELVFKKGYCHFVRKEFQQAQYEFSYSKDLKNKYFYPINYYYGMCEYFSGDYADAVKSFQRVEGSSVYAKHIPYYICQIYFAEKNFEKLVSYGERSILDSKTKKKPEIRQLLGQAYFLGNDYERALPHLEAYEAVTPTLTVEEFYQLAFTQYKLGYYDRAVDNFLEISREDSKMGQQVNYYLADCYIKTDDLTSARAAFKKVSQMNYEDNMQEEATFNYGKLSSQMGFEREAINILMAVDTSSPYHTESQHIINNILVNTSDYQNAITILESLPVLSTELEGTYQDIAYKRAIQLLAEGEEDACLAMLEKSQQYPYSDTVNAKTEYWRGYIAMSRGDHDASLNNYNKYFVHQKKAGKLPEESAKYMAHYNQGYNHLKLDEYYFAVDQFQFAIEGIEGEPALKNAAIRDRVLPDAYVRAGDALFKEKRYTQSKKYYDGAIDMKKGAFVYALYQRALIEGLEKDNYAKILTLEEIIKGHPQSDYADDALLQLGDTYLSTGNPEPAAAAYNKLATNYQGKSNLVNAAYLKLGLITYNAGDAYQALTYYKKVFGNNPNSKESQEAMLAIEEIYIDDLGKGDDFIAFADSIPGYKIDAFAKDSLNFKVGENQYNNAEYERAITSFDNYLSKYSQGYYRLSARYLRGESLALGKKYSRALKDYEAIIGEGISDYYERSLKKAAIISYNYTQNFTKALKYYKELEALTNNPEDKFQAQLGAMRSAFRLGKNDAVVTYANAVNNNSLSSSAEKSAAMYYLGKVSYTKGQLEQAAAAFKQVAQLSSNNQAAESRYMLAKISYDQNQLDQAAQQVESANSKNAAYPYWIAKSLLLMSDIFSQREDLLNARAAVEAVLENFKDDAALVEEANAKLLMIKQKEDESNRIKANTPAGILELDTTRN